MAREKLGRLVVEGFVITVSILLAFGLDAWWDGRAEGLDEQELLASLQAEFEGVDAEFLRARTIHYDRQRSGEILVGIIDEGLPLPSPDSLWALMSAMQRATTIDPPNGILSSTIGAGTLALIADDSLRTLLAGWPGRIADHTKTEGNVRDYIHTVFLGWFAENGAYPALSGPSSEWRAGVTALVRHQTYRGHLWYLLNASGRVLNENAQMRDEASTIQDLLQESLR